MRKSSIFFNLRLWRSYPSYFFDLDSAGIFPISILKNGVVFKARVNRLFCPCVDCQQIKPLLPVAIPRIQDLILSRFVVFNCSCHCFSLSRLSSSAAGGDPGRDGLLARFDLFVSRVSPVTRQFYGLYTFYIVFVLFGYFLALFKAIRYSNG